jgi:hypothetical protein
MDKLDKDLLERIGKALNITFHEWQINYILGMPMILDMKITGRATGKTLVYIIKLLFTDDKPIRAYDIHDIAECSDWWSCYRIPVVGLRENHYAGWFRCYFTDIYKAIELAGIKTRPVFLSEQEYRVYMNERGIVK